MTNARLIGPERLRQTIPEDVRRGFEWLTNDELAYIRNYGRSDRLGDLDRRAYAGWELDYRVAAGIEVYLDIPPPEESDLSIPHTNDIRRRVRQ